MDDDARTHLQHLAEVLRCQRWSVQLDADRAVLQIANPEIPGIQTRIECCRASDEWVYRWLKGAAIGPVAEVSDVAERIQHVLRGVES